MGVWTRAIIQFLDQGNCLPLLVATSFINRCFKTLILVRIILRSFNWTYILNVLIKRRTQADSLYQEIFSISPMDNLSTPSPFTHCPKYFFPPGVQGNICIVFRWRPILPASPRPPPEEQLQDQLRCQAWRQSRWRTCHHLQLHLFSLRRHSSFVLQKIVI